MFNKIAAKLESHLHGGEDQNAEGGHSGGLAALGAMGAAAAGYLHHHHGKDDSSDSSDDDHHGLIAAGALVGLAALAFFYHVKKRKQQDFVVLVDASASMQSGVFNPLGATRWSETQKALDILATKACEIDPDGLTLYFFNDRVQKFPNVRTVQDVDKVFQTFHPDGFTDLTSALDAAFEEHFGKKKPRPTSILVIHDGEPNNEETVRQSLRNAANRISKKKELSISFVQVGEDPKATAFLQNLDTGLGTKYDIVDTVKCTEIAGKPFSECVATGLA